MAQPLQATENVSAEISRNLALELVRVTEAGALASARWMGRGDKNTADGAAVDAMRRALGRIPMDGVVVIGQGEKDEAPMLYIGEKIGSGRRRRRPDRRHHLAVERTSERDLGRRHGSRAGIPLRRQARRLYA